MQTLSTFLIGYSIFSAIVIAVSHFRSTNYAEQRSAQTAGLALITILAVMQWIHFTYLQHADESIHGMLYRMQLFAVAPLFYLFSKPLLQVQVEFKPLYLLHLIPIVVVAFIPYTIALPLAFALGAFYLLWLALAVYKLRSQRSRFWLEIMILGVVFDIALVVAVLGINISWLGEQNFYLMYSSAIGVAFLLISLLLAERPQLVREVEEVARESYAVTTLANVDCPTVLARLESLMIDDKLYMDASLNLASVAQRIGLSTHQLSELINTHLGKNFSRYLREYRVKAAEKMLVSEPNASVLSVGLSVGFTSQSGFYEAFREISGTTPARYRNIHRSLNAPD